MPPNNKKQRGREEKKKRNEAKKVAEAEQAQQKAAEVHAQQELALKRAEVENNFRRTQLEAELRRQFATPAIDDVIKDMAHSASTNAAAAANSSSTSTTEQEEGVVVCYHGSSAEQFAAGTSAFLKIAQSFVALHKKYYTYGKFTDRYQKYTAAYNKFLRDTENRKIMNNVECTNFVFALGVSLYLKLTSTDKEKYHRLQTRSLGEKKKTASYELETILQLGLVIKYSLIPRMIGEKDDNLHDKYLRDSETERGVINCLYRETKNHCGCMVTDKDRANDMDKRDRCHKCRKEFPKARTMVCDGCEQVVYCSDECCANDWPLHKKYCKELQEIKRKMNDKMKKKMAAATTDTTGKSATTELILTPGAVGARTNKSQSSPTAIEEPSTTEVVPTKPVASVVSPRAHRDTVLTTTEELRLLNTPVNPNHAIPTGAQSPPAAVVIAPTSQTQKPAPTPKSISKPVLGPLGANKPVATTAILPPPPTESVTKVDRGVEGVKPNMDIAVDDVDSNETTK